MGRDADLASCGGEPLELVDLRCRVPREVEHLSGGETPVTVRSVNFTPGGSPNLWSVTDAMVRRVIEAVFALQVLVRSRISVTSGYFFST